jgi:primosomal protein N' (replication factor Y)
VSKLPVAQVIVDVRVRDCDRLFDYSVPPHLADRLRPGHRIVVPFGHRYVEGYVIRYPTTSSIASLKPVQRLLDQQPVLAPARLRLAEWLSERYLCLQAQALQCWLPPGTSLRARARAVPLYRDIYQLSPEHDPTEAAGSLSRAPRQLEAYRLIMARGGCITRDNARSAGIPPGILNALVERGLVEKVRSRAHRDPWQGQEWQRDDPPLTADQARAVAHLDEAISRGRGQFLLFGVTGSGKTRVYLSAIATALRQGRSAIVLVPEISLTPQAVAAYRGWFGDRVAVLHSRLSASERADQWWAAARGDVQVVLGARSAVFAPMANLGLIVVDEKPRKRSRRIS